jgi:hypothetical protein
MVACPVNDCLCPYFENGNCALKNCEQEKEEGCKMGACPVNDWLCPYFENGNCTLKNCEQKRKEEGYKMARVQSMIELVRAIDKKTRNVK